MLQILPSMLTTTVFGAETALETASLQQAKGHLQASPIELFGRDAGSLNGRRYVCLSLAKTLHGQAIDWYGVRHIWGKQFRMASLLCLFNPCPLLNLAPLKQLCSQHELCCSQIAQLRSIA